MRLALVAAFFVCATAEAQTGLLDRVGTLIDSVARGLNLVGERSEKVIGPSLQLPGDLHSVDLANLETATHQFDESYPVGRPAVISVTNEFGPIHVSSWDSQVVRVEAEITVSAASLDIAKQVAKAIEIHVTETGTRLDIGTLLPDTRNLGNVVTEVGYHVTVPKSASLELDNYFGDTLVRDVTGGLSLRSRYGAVDLGNVGGPAHVQAIGEFPLKVRGLAEGGHFTLRGLNAEFYDVGGTLVIGNYLGRIQMQNIRQEANVEVIGESTPIHLYLQDPDATDLSVLAYFGSIDSEQSFETTTRGHMTRLERPNLDSTRHISLNSYFDTVYLHSVGVPNESQRPVEGSLFPVKGELSETVTVSADAELVVDAVIGDVRVEATDDTRIQVQAVQLVRVQTAASARAALDALTLTLEQIENRVMVRSAVLDDMAALGCSSYRVDLQIRCPRTVRLRIQAASGQTEVTGMTNAVVIEQTEGDVAVRNVPGEIDLTAHKGNVRVEESGGPVTVSAKYGSVDLRQIKGKLTVWCVKGKTVIDTPQGAVNARNQEGDIRILAFDGVGGDYDAIVDKGNLSIVLPDDLDGTLYVTCEGGSVYSAIPLTGSTEKDEKKFQARLKDGRYTLTLQARGGNIRID